MNSHARVVTHHAVSLDEAVYQVIAEIDAIRPHNYSPAMVRRVATEMYDGAWWLDELIAATNHELGAL